MYILLSVCGLHEVCLVRQVFLFTAFISLITGVLFGLVPAWQASKLNLVEAIKNSTQTNHPRALINNHSVLVGFQIALVAVLLVGAILMLKSFRRLLAVDPGFRAQGVATFQVALPWTRYSNGPQRAQFYQQAQSRLKSLPGVHQVGAISRLPLAGSENMNYI